MNEARWYDLFRCFRMAADPVKIWFGFLGVVFAVLVLLVSAAALIQVRQVSGGEISGRIASRAREGDLHGAASALGEGVRSTWEDLRLDVAKIGRSLGDAGFMAAIERAATLHKVVSYVLIVLMLVGLPWAYFGGAISRSAAVEYATGGRLSRAEVHEYAASRHSSYFWPPVALGMTVAALLAAGVALGLAAAHLLSAAAILAGGFASLYVLVVVKQKTLSVAGGWAAGLPCFAVTILCSWLLWDVPLLWAGRVGLVIVFPVVLALAAAALLLLAVLFCGRGLMTSAVSFESTDSFDAAVRAGDYVLRRPWRLAFYWLAAALYGVPCVAFVAALAAGAFFTALAAVWAGFGGSFTDVYAGLLDLGKEAAFFESVPSFLMGLVVVILCGLVAGWCLSFVQCCRAVCYALLRQSVDLSGPSEVFMEPGRGYSRAPGPSPVQQ
ncbi:MAG: hypothetical protein ABIF82_09655 [Planctomycetota bacterium]